MDKNNLRYVFINFYNRWYGMPLNLQNSQISAVDQPSSFKWITASRSSSDNRGIVNECRSILITLLLYPFCVFACFRVCVFAGLRVCGFACLSVCVDKIEFLRAENFVFACCNLRVCVQLSTYNRILLYM